MLAVVTAGIYLGWHTPELTSFQTRLQGGAVWEIFTFVLNALLFVLVGLQLPRILDALTGFSAAELMWWGVLVTLTVVVARLVFVPVFTYLPSRFLGAFDARTTRRRRAAVHSWSRGQACGAQSRWPRRWPFP